MGLEIMGPPEQWQPVPALPMRGIGERNRTPFSRILQLLTQRRVVEGFLVCFGVFFFSVFFIKNRNLMYRRSYSDLLQNIPPTSPRTLHFISPAIRCVVPTVYQVRWVQDHEGVVPEQTVRGTNGPSVWSLQRCGQELGDKEWGSTRAVNSGGS